MKWHTQLSFFFFLMLLVSVRCTSVNFGRPRTTLSAATFEQFAVDSQTTFPQRHFFFFFFHKSLFFFFNHLTRIFAVPDDIKFIHLSPFNPGVKGNDLVGQERKGARRGEYDWCAFVG